MKERLDILIVNKGLAASREKAKAIIMSGIVYVDGQKEDKAGSMFEETANIEVREICQPRWPEIREGNDSFWRPIKR